MVPLAGDNGFTFDFAGHIMFSHDPYVHELYRLLLGDNVHWQDREAWIYSKEVYTRYPFQGALYGLPPAVIKECVVGRHRGPLRRSVAKKAASDEAARTTPALSAAGCSSRSFPARCTASRLGARRHYGGPDRRRCVVTGTPRNFKEFIYKVWGAGIAKHFAIPYNQKLWAVPLERDGDLVARRPGAAARSRRDDRRRALPRRASPWAPTPASDIRCGAGSRR